MAQDLRNELEIAITNHNKKFEQLTQQAVNCEKEDEKELLFQKRWQFIHDYATELSNFLWEHKQVLSADDLSALDSVLYNVWQKMSEKSNIVVQTIMKIYKGESID